MLPTGRGAGAGTAGETLSPQRQWSGTQDSSSAQGAGHTRISCRLVLMYCVAMNLDPDMSKYCSQLKAANRPEPYPQA